MQRRSAKYLEDIVDAAVFIIDTTRDVDQESYRVNRVLRNAVERNFEIIGEAVRRLSDSDPNTAKRLGDYREIIDFRNILIHGYDLIDEQLVWSAIHDHLPNLLLTARNLLAQDPPD
jgi:uncharacterized protein with HEPN domain